MSDEITDEQLWAWLEENAFSQHFRPSKFPGNAEDKLWRVSIVDDEGKMHWHYGPTFKEAVRAALTDPF